MSRPAANLIVQIEDLDGQTESFHPASKDPLRRPQDIEITSKLGVGFESAKVTFPHGFRGREASTLLKTIRCVGAGGFVANECRIHGNPSSSEQGVSVHGVGWMNHGKDLAWGMNFIDSDMSAWGDLSLERRIALTSLDMGSLSVSKLRWDFGSQALPTNTFMGQLYTAPPGMLVARIIYTATQANYPAGWRAALLEFDDNPTLSSPASQSLTINGAEQDYTLSTASRYAEVNTYANGAGVTPTAGANLSFSSMAVLGNHGLAAVTASECLKYGLANACPLFNWTDDSIQDTDLELAQLMVAQDERFTGLLEKINGLYLYYAHVWEQRQFSWGPLSDDTIADYEMSTARGDHFENTGDQVDESGPFNECYVIFQDVTNGNRETMIGPDDSDLLVDTSTENICNAEGIPRHAVLKAQYPTSPEMASLYGWAYLRDHNQPNRQGQASTAGPYVKKSNGAWVPAYQMRAGETVKFAHSETVHRIHGTRYSTSTKSADLEFDSLPYTTDALFERLGIALVGIN